VACIFTETGRVTLNSRTLKVAGTVRCIRANSRTGTAPQRAVGTEHSSLSERLLFGSNSNCCLSGLLSQVYEHSPAGGPMEVTDERQLATDEERDAFFEQYFGIRF
jgi:hypothetical protein